MLLCVLCWAHKIPVAKALEQVVSIMVVLSIIDYTYVCSSLLSSIICDDIIVLMISIAYKDDLGASCEKGCAEGEH